MKLIILLLLSASLHAQSSYHFALTRCVTTGIDIGYSYGGTVFGEFGLKSNGQEYYSMPYIGGGVQTKGKVMASLSTGYGPIFNIPQLDRHGDIILTPGYDYKVMSCIYVSGRIGYGKKLQVYVEGTMSGRNWLGIGLTLKSK